MTFAFTLLLGCMIGGVIVYLVMRRDDEPGEELVAAKAEAAKVVKEAEATLTADLIPIKMAQAKLKVIKKMKDPDKQLEAMAEFTNRDRSKE